MEAKNYAKALFEILESKNTSKEEFYKFVKIFEVIISQPNLFNILANPTISDNAKLDLLADLPTKLQYFIFLIWKSKKLYIIKKIQQEFRHCINKKFGRCNIEITSASDKYDDEIIKKFTQDVEYDITHIIDKNIIGGYIIRIGSKTLDKSINKYLKDLSLYMIND